LKVHAKKFIDFANGVAHVCGRCFNDDLDPCGTGPVSFEENLALLQSAIINTARLHVWLEYFRSYGQEIVGAVSPLAQLLLRQVIHRSPLNSEARKKVFKDIEAIGSLRNDPRLVFSSVSRAGL